MATISCDLCQLEVQDDDIHKAEHIQQAHPSLSGKGHREWCEPCQIWHARSQRSRHYNAHKNGEPFIAPNNVQVFDPQTLKYVHRRRTIGPRSKHYTPNAASTPSRSPQPVSITSASIQSATARDDLDFETRSAQYLAAVQAANAQAIRDMDALIQKATDTISHRLHQAEEQRKAKNPQSKGTARVKFVVEDIKSRIDEDLPAYRAAFQYQQVGEPISATQYLNHIANDTLHTPEHRHRYVLCDNADARRILETGFLDCPIVILGGQTEQLPRDKFVNQLRSYTLCDVQDLWAPIKEFGRAPTSITGEEAATMFERDPDAKINLLNLVTLRDDPFPHCIRGLDAYDILFHLSDYGVAGKRPFYTKRDLTNCAHFSICAKAGVWSAAHQDHYGLVTTVTGEFGEKIWLSWPKLTPTERADWANIGRQQPIYPPLPAYSLLLRPGDVLVQPSGHVHAPLTLSDCLMSGTQHFHSPSMHQHLQTANFEAEHDHVTNEDPSQEALVKFASILTQMLNKNPRWPWPSDAAQQTVIQQYQDHFRKYSKDLPACDCLDKGGCERTDTSCPCQVLGIGCRKACHTRTAWKTKNLPRRTDGLVKCQGYDLFTQVDELIAKFQKGQQDNQGDQVGEFDEDVAMTS